MIDPFTLHHGDCLEVMAGMPENSVDSVITDPPYGLSFMGKAWDHGVPGVPFWAEALRVAKPGAMLLAFGGTRTHHRLMCAIEDAGWEIRDAMMFLYGTGFPKSLDISKELDRHGGAAVAWFGPWLRAWRLERGITQKEIAELFPSKSGQRTGCVANWELGLNMPTCEQFNMICRTFNLPFDSIEEAEREITRTEKQSLLAVAPGSGCERPQIRLNRTAPATPAAQTWQGWGTALKPAWEPIILAMKPCDGTFAQNAQRWGVAGLNVDGGRIGTGDVVPGGGKSKHGIASGGTYGKRETPENTPSHTQGRWPANLMLDETAAAMLGPESRFFYTAKASSAERGEGNSHPTIKPLDLMQYLCRLTKPPTDGVVLDPFMGSGSTGVAALREGRQFIGIELNPDYLAIARERIINDGPLLHWSEEVCSTP